MSNKPIPLNDGYQPAKSKGYQPAPSTTTTSGTESGGYQPASSEGSEPTSPPPSKK